MLGTFTIYRTTLTHLVNTSEWCNELLPNDRAFETMFLQLAVYFTLPVHVIVVADATFKGTKYEEIMEELVKAFGFQFHTVGVLNITTSPH